MIESSFTDDSNCSSNHSTDAKGAGFANPVVSSNIWSILDQDNKQNAYINFQNTLIMVKNAN